MGLLNETTSYFLSWKELIYKLCQWEQFWILEIRELDFTFCFPSQQWHNPYYLVLMRAPRCANSCSIEKNSGGHVKNKNKNLKAWNMEVKEF